MKSTFGLLAAAAAWIAAPAPVAAHGLHDAHLIGSWLHGIFHGVEGLALLLAAAWLVVRAVRRRDTRA